MGVFFLRYKAFIVYVAVVMHCVSIASAIDVSAKSAILYEPSCGKILYQKDINTPREIASTTKIMTAILALEHLDPERMVTVKAEDTGVEGTSMYLKPDEKLSVNSLLHGLMLQSGNDAALVLASETAGDSDAFVDLMNAKADELGMQNTRFKNPNGLPEEGHCSTAYDMAKLAGYAMLLPEFRDIVSKKAFSAEGRAFVNHNKLLKMSEDIDGIKTGYTKAAGRCLVSSASKDGMRLIAVTLSAPDDWNDHLKLYEMGFESYGKEIFLQAGQQISSVPVVGADISQVFALSAGELAAVLPKEQLSSVKMEIYLPRFLYPPIQNRQQIGEARLIHGDKVISKTALVSAQACQVKEKETFLDRLMDLFSFFR